MMDERRKGELEAAEGLQEYIDGIDLDEKPHMAEHVDRVRRYIKALESGDQQAILNAMLTFPGAAFVLGVSDED